MSAFLVNVDHLRLLVEAAGRPGGGHEGPLRWNTEDAADVFARHADSEAAWAEWTATSREVSIYEPERCQEVLEMLFRENLASIHARYPDTAEDPADLPGPVEIGDAMAGSLGTWVPVFEPVMGPNFRPVEVLKALDCYEYQSCEHDGWRRSEARRFVEALRRRMISKLPGYSDAPWEWERPAPVRRSA